jgi:hypothetical protein
MAEDWVRLAAAVKKRRSSRKWSYDEIHDAGGPSDVVLSRIENNGEPRPRGDSIQKLDAGLAWRPGSAVDVLNGGDPVPLEGITTTTSEWSDEELVEEMHRLMDEVYERLLERRSADDLKGRTSPNGLSPRFRGGIRRRQPGISGDEDDDKRRQLGR